MPAKRDVPAHESGIAPPPYTAPLGPWASYTFAARPVFATMSAYQHIEIVDLAAFGALGRAYRLDGRFMASLADAHICHECMVHPLLLAHGNVERVLVLGGGDGGSACEVLRHVGVREVVVAELDPQVPSAILQHMPALADGAFDDPCTTLVIGDARNLVDAALARGERFDAVIFDLTEADTPNAPAAALHDAAFFAKVRELLSPRGGIALQLGAPWFEADHVRRMLDALRSVFACVQPMTTYVPLYGTQWALAFASDSLDVRGSIVNTLPEALQRLRHYSPSRHAALFDIPPELTSVLDGGARHLVTR
ncbi:MAG: hypothetical protein P4M06_07990 [Pandoraea sp.]|nr:hypothetical protein [Pandoraea sp.]MDR3397486.1 hypothetical protein [Pandoraea sp.]